MSRLLAFMLALSFSAPLITPLLSAEPESQLPACCRRDGKHACSMMQAARAKAAGLQFQALKVPCADYPGGHTLPAAERIQLAMQPTAWAVPAGNRIILPAAPSSAYRGMAVSSTRERGPPSSFHSL